MKQTSILVISILILAACNNQAENKEGTARTHNDSLMEQVMDGHNEAMARSSKISRAERKTELLLDSLSKLPAPLQKANHGLQVHLDSLLTALKNASSGMDNWMNEFNMDSLKNDESLRAKYLESEKQKVNGIKEEMVVALKKADSILSK